MMYLSWIMLKVELKINVSAELKIGKLFIRKGIKDVI